MRVLIVIAVGVLALIGAWTLIRWILGRLPRSSDPNTGPGEAIPPTGNASDAADASGRGASWLDHPRVRVASLVVIIIILGALSWSLMDAPEHPPENLIYHPPRLENGRIIPGWFQ